MNLRFYQISLLQYMCKMSAVSNLYLHQRFHSSATLILLFQLILVVISILIITIIPLILRDVSD